MILIEGGGSGNPRETTFTSPLRGRLCKSYFSSSEHNSIQTNRDLNMASIIQGTSVVKRCKVREEVEEWWASGGGMGRGEN